MKLSAVLVLLSLAATAATGQQTCGPFSMTVTGVVEVGDDLSTEGLIHAKASSSPFAGQVIINSLNGTSNAWVGEVKYGSGSGTAIGGGPYYTSTASTWGGGAVGLAPFHLHDEDCFPANGATHSASPSSFTLTFYGPVTWATGFPFAIEYSTDNGETWDPDMLWISYHDPSGLTGKGSRTIVLIYDSNSGIIPSGRLYRVTPDLVGDNALLCDDLLTTSDVTVDPFIYTFTVP